MMSLKLQQRKSSAIAAKVRLKMQRAVEKELASGEMKKRGDARTLSTVSAARRITKSTLHRRVHMERFRLTVKKAGRRPALKESEEAIIVELMMSRADQVHPLFKKDSIDVVGTMVEKMRAGRRK